MIYSQLNSVQCDLLKWNRSLATCNSVSFIIVILKSFVFIVIIIISIKKNFKKYRLKGKILISRPK